MRGVRTAVGIVVLGIVLFIVLGTSGGFAGSGRALGAATTVTIISGDIQVRHGSTGSSVSATDGEVLVAGDTVRSGDGARAVLTYFEGSTVSVEPNTELTIETASSFADGSTVVVMQQAIGRTWHVVTKLTSGNSRYEVRTPASTASVRGTTFQVETDGERTVVTTTEGTVVDRVADPDRAGQTIDVPVPAGKTHEQRKNARPTPASAAPQPERTLILTVDGQNSLVIDAEGRANGIDKDGRRHIETPGARLVKTADGKLQIVLPNVSDGRLEALVRGTGRGDVDVQTTVEHKGSEPVEVNGKVQADTNGQGRVNVDVNRTADGRTGVNQSMPGPGSVAPTAADAVSSGKKP